jgi:hypothetical protein
MSVAAAALNSDTLPEGNAWFQQIERPSPDVGLIGAQLTSGVSQALVARDYADRSYDQQEKSWGTVEVSRQVSRRIVEAIDRKVRANFPAIAPAPALSLQPLQEWEGYVLDIRADTFTARLADVTAGSKLEEEIAEFPLADLSDDDRQLLAIGAIFRWVIGYQRSPAGTKRRVSQVTFRRLPAWTKSELKQANKRAQELVTGIIWD